MNSKFMNQRLSKNSAYWNLPTDQLLTSLETTKNGLNITEAEKRLKDVGPNSLTVTRRVTPLILFLNQFKSPLVLILLFAVLVSAFAQEWIDATVILVIVVASAVITFIQEYSATNAVEKLRAHLSHTVNTLRDKHEQSILVETIVPGDVVMLSAGNLIPADGLVLEAKDFFVNQAVLTGETFPAKKEAGVVPESASLTERTNCVFMGTSVRSGTAKALIVQTGAATNYGQIADRLSLRPPETEFERGIRHFGLMLSQIMIVLILIVFAMNVVSAKPPIDSLLFAIALAVGISPELLPAIITINLSKGARTMAKQGVIVRQLNAIENFGSMDILCTDKTGTLTEGVVRLDGALDVSGNASDEVFRFAYLNAHFQTGISNPLDEAITSQKQLDLKDVTKLDEVPYDFTRKRLSIIVQEKAGVPLFITKGALNNVLQVCSSIREGERTTSLDENKSKQIQERFVQWSDQGFRVLGIAIKPMEKGSNYTSADEHDMMFAGFLLFFDPPKADVTQAIEALEKLGVRLKIITGDNQRVALHVAEAVKLPMEGMLSGAELNQLRDEALWYKVEHTDLFVDVDPNQKERIIRALQKRNHVVGYMGDGINDAPALYDADVGISVESAVDVAREASDFVLLKPGLDVLRRGIEEGRVTFANSLKYIFTTTSANFGNMFSMAGASLFLPFLPLLAKQILLNNFLSDFPAIAIASDNVDREYIQTPHRWDVKFIRDFMIVFGLVSSMFDFLTFGLLLWIIHSTPEQFRTGWFIESLLTELLVALIVRTRYPFYQSKPGHWLWISTLIVALITLTIPYLPLNDLLGFVPLPSNVMSMLLIITLLYVIATEFAKRIFYARVATHS